MFFKFISYYKWIFFSVISITLLAVYFSHWKKNRAQLPEKKTADFWHPPDTSELTNSVSDKMIRYGRSLIAGTAGYLGPKGSLAHISNGMNCQNCHLDAGTRLYGNNFALVSTGYPVYRDRSGRIESIEYRINECMQRSLNGQKLDSQSLEMRSMTAYIRWVGKNVIKGSKLPGTGSAILPFMDRAADSVRGRLIYESKCKVCHGTDGHGQPDSVGYVYPPLWGSNSFNISAGMYRIFHLANFIKHNMPFKPVQTPPQLSDEEAWDVAAFILSQERPKKIFRYDWHDIKTKPIDYPFGPYADHFSEVRHKYGPFGEIKNEKALLTKNKQ
jgi:thiosulfate dehydrogenase